MKAHFIFHLCWVVSSARIERQPSKTRIDIDLNLEEYRTFLLSKYSRSYALQQFNNMQKHYECFNNPQKINEIPTSNRANILKTMVNLSKFLGCYEDYKLKLKNHGIHWVNGDTSFNAFMRITNNNQSTLGLWYNTVQGILRDNEKLYLKFTLQTGIRKNEAKQAFNMIIDLARQNSLGEFYNSEIEALEFYKYPEFNRRTKKVYLSFVDSELIQQIANSQPVSYYAIRKRLSTKKQNCRIKELRSYFATYLRKQGILPEIVDLLQGRIEAKNVQLGHYFKIADLKVLSHQILALTSKIEDSLVLTQHN